MIIFLRQLRAKIWLNMQFGQPSWIFPLANSTCILKSPSNPFFLTHFFHMETTFILLYPDIGHQLIVFSLYCHYPWKGGWGYKESADFTFPPEILVSFAVFDIHWYSSSFWQSLGHVRDGLFTTHFGPYWGGSGGHTHRLRASWPTFSWWDKRYD